MSCPHLRKILMDSDIDPHELLTILVPDVDVGVVAKFLQLLYVGTTILDDSSEFDQMKEFGTTQLGFFMLINWNIQVEMKSSDNLSKSFEIEEKMSSLRTHSTSANKKGGESPSRKHRNSFIESLEKQIADCKAILTSKPSPVDDFQREMSLKRLSSANDLDSATSKITIKEDILETEEHLSDNGDVVDDVDNSSDEGSDFDLHFKEDFNQEIQPKKVLPTKENSTNSFDPKRTNETTKSGSISAKRSRSRVKSSTSMEQEGMKKCNSCDKSYPPFYFSKHKCKGPPRYEVSLTCHLCNTTFNTKSNIIRHYVKVHKVIRSEIPETILKAKGEMKKPKMCKFCQKYFSQLSSHSCRK
jgi:hypothetical protein